jgi:hypothetical protein
MFYRRATKLVPDIDMRYNTRCRQLHAAKPPAPLAPAAAAAAAVMPVARLPGGPTPSSPAVHRAATKSEAPQKHAPTTAEARARQASTDHEDEEQASDEHEENGLETVVEGSTEIEAACPHTGTHIGTLPLDLLVLIFSFVAGAEQVDCAYLY